MSFIKRILLFALSIGFLVIAIPLFAMLGLAAIGIMLVSGLIGAFVLRNKVKQNEQSSFAKAYYDQRSAFHA